MSDLAIVTGGTRGIGKAISIYLKDSGYKVIATYISNDQAAKELSKEHDIETHKFDITNFDECSGFINRIIEKNGKISILVNNAGITRDKMMHKMQKEDWNDVISTNLSSCFNMCNAIINHMRENNYGRIVNISSINALTGQVGQTNYSASKAGILGLTKALAKESAGKGITVNAIAPGYIKTDMTSKIPDDILSSIMEQIPVKRLGEPKEIARLVNFLASPESGFITGETISINGGHHIG
jgi:acetoacetyl-CoA reductase